VRDAYLLCRIADTVEDAPNLGATAKAELLTLLSECFDDATAPSRFARRAETLAGDPAHVRLARNAVLVFAAYGDLPPATRLQIRRWVCEMIGGMRTFVLAYPAGVRIQTLDEYREYCYYVAGTVGYLLTDLWRAHAPSIDDNRYEQLRNRCRAFAEALQTVNILKDVATDAEHENSIYIPEEVLREHGGAHAAMLEGHRQPASHAALGALIDLASRDLAQATEYLLLLPRRAPSIRLFCALPLLFAHATLREIIRMPDAVARKHVVKITRLEVKTLTALSFVSVCSNRVMAWLVARTRARPAAL
jgi:farnesyl-diphosphate farnesyltransferase